MLLLVTYHPVAIHYSPSRISYPQVGMGHLGIRPDMDRFFRISGFSGLKIRSYSGSKNFWSGSSQILPDPCGFGSNVKELENNCYISEMGSDNSNQSNHITRFGLGILYPNYPKVPKILIRYGFI